MCPLKVVNKQNILNIKSPKLHSCVFVRVCSCIQAFEIVRYRWCAIQQQKIYFLSMYTRLFSGTQKRPEWLQQTLFTLFYVHWTLCFIDNGHECFKCVKSQSHEINFAIKKGVWKEAIRKCHTLIALGYKFWSNNPHRTNGLICLSSWF